MQQRFLLQILLLAQHVSDTTMPIIRSSGALYSGCCLWYFVLWFSSCCILQTGHITLNSTPDQQLENHSTKYHRQQPLYNALELLMMGVVVPETCWASNKICDKNLCASSWHFISTYHWTLLSVQKSPFAGKHAYFTPDGIRQMTAVTGHICFHRTGVARLFSHLWCPDIPVICGQLNAALLPDCQPLLCTHR